MSSIHGGSTAPAREDRRSSFGQADAPHAAADAFSGLDDVVLVARRRRFEWIIPFGVTACYALFALAVHLRLLDALDLAVRRMTRAGEVWGPAQVRANNVAHALEPAHLALPLLIFTAVLSVARRSLRPVAVVAVVGTPVAIVTLGSKWIMAHTEGDAAPVGHGSFPSGHMVSIIMVFGLVVLLLAPRTRWGWMLPAFMGCFMGWLLLVAFVHPATDVVGAALLAAAALTAARTARLGHWASDRQSGSVG